VEIITNKTHTTPVAVENITKEGNETQKEDEPAATEFVDITGMFHPT